MDIRADSGGESEVELVLALALAVPAVRSASVCVRPGDAGPPETLAATSADARQFEAIQHVLDKGPCIEAIRLGAPCNVVISSGDSSWPEFDAQASDLGIRSVLSTPFMSDGRVQGALNFYSIRSRPFDGGELFVADGLAAMVSRALPSPIAGAPGLAGAAPGAREVGPVGDAGVAGAFDKQDQARMVGGARELLSRLLRKSSQLIPDDLPKLVADEAKAVGFLDAVIFLADLEERVLTPLGRPRLDPQEIDGTLAGRAFKVEQPFLSRNAEGVTIWLPLIDGAERLGTLCLRSPVDSQAVVDAASDVAGLVAELIVTKSAYGDALVLARRRQPMTLAAELRWAMLPPITFRDQRVTIACVLEPAYQVAGDAFDYAINEGVLHLAVFDAMGHGLEASRMATVAVAGYRFSRRRGLDLESTYHMLDRTILEQFGDDRFVTAQLATLDAHTGTLRWLAAGHPQPLLLRQSRVAHALSSDPALPLGLGDGRPTVAEVSLEPGDRLFFFTDGVVEARSPGGERFGQDRLVDLTRRALSDQQTLAATVRRLALSVRDHREGPLDDDATILFVGWHPEGTL